MLSELLNSLFPCSSTEVAKRGGDINETMGDGFMAIFQNSDSFQHAVQAAAASLALLSATEALNADNHQQPLDVAARDCFRLSVAWLNST